MQYNPITDGLLKAFRFLAEEQQRKAQGPKRKKYEIEDLGQLVHMTKCVSQEDRAAVRDLIVQIRATTDQHERQVLTAKLRQFDVAFVPFKRAHRIDHSRYTAQALRDIRAAGGGAKERARANKRAGLTSSAIAAQ